MDVVTRSEFEELLSLPRGRCVSLFLPTHRAGPDSRAYAQEDVIRFKNLLREAERQLLATGQDARGAQTLLEPARALLDEETFWQYQSEGLAVFVAPELFRTYRVPVSVPELVVVAEQLHVKPLLALLAGDGRFYILALSQNEVRLLEGTRDRVSGVDLTTAPRSLQEALRYDDPQRQLQAHTRAPRQAGRRAAVFHGHGVGTDDAKDPLRRFCQQVDHGLTEMLRNGKAPLVLAGVDYLQAVYRGVSAYPALIETGIPGNPEGLRPDELHARAWPLVEPRFRQAREAATERFMTRLGTGKATRDLAETVRAAAAGRVEELFVAVGVQRWGLFDAASGALEEHAEAQPGDDDLLNLAAVQTLRTSGTVYVVAPGEMPEKAQVAAVFRY